MTRPHGTPTRYKHGPGDDGRPGGCRCPSCRAAVAAYDSRRARLIAYGRWEHPLDAAGTRRRLQALIWNGWSAHALASRYGCTTKAIWKMLRYDRVSPATAAQVRVLYRELCTQLPPDGQSATKARKHARARGWAPVGAWEDDPGPHCIDDPAASPDRSGRPPTGSPSVAAKIREARRAAGMTQRHLAVALGVSEAAVQHWEQADRSPSPESWVQLELTLGPLGIVRDPKPEPGEDAEYAA